MTFISAILTYVTIKYLTKYKEHSINKANLKAESSKKKYLDLAKFTFLNTKPEKKKEMLDLLDDTIEK